MEVNQETIPHFNQAALDYTNQLEHCYRFCPTDSDLIVHCLNAKIESRKLPKCQLHEVDIYLHKPDELAERYLGENNKWYFLTPRNQMYANGDRPKRATGDFGTWKATQCKTKVYENDDESGQMIGFRASLAYHDYDGKKTMWLMHEYTTANNNKKKFNDWALCKIYKHDKKKTTNGNRAEVVPIKTTNQEDVNRPSPTASGGQTSEVVTEGGKETCERPSSKRRRASKIHESSNRHVAFQETNVQMVDKVVETRQSLDNFVQGLGNSYTSPNPISMQQMVPPVEIQRSVDNFHRCSHNRRNTSHNSITTQTVANFQDLISIQPRPSYNYQKDVMEHYLNNSRNDYQFTNGASRSSMEPLAYGGYTAALDPTPVKRNEVFQQNMHNSYQDSETLLDVVQKSSNQSMVVPRNAADHQLVPDAPAYEPLDHGGYTAVLDSNKFLQQQTSVNQFTVVPDQNAAGGYNATKPPPDPDPGEFSSDDDVWQSICFDFPSPFEIGQRNHT